MTGIYIKKGFSGISWKDRAILDELNIKLKYVKGSAFVTSESIIIRETEFNKLSWYLMVFLDELKKATKKKPITRLFTYKIDKIEQPELPKFFTEFLDPSSDNAKLKFTY